MITVYYDSGGSTRRISSQQKRKKIPISLVDDKDKRDTTEKDQAAMPVDMASVDINKRNIRIFDEVFSADEEVQVNSL